MKRVFFALMLGPGLGRELGNRTRMALGGEASAGDFRLPRPEGLHLTLLFLGDVEEERLEPLFAGVAGACAGLERPALVVDHAGCFPRKAQERVLWLGVREVGAAGLLEALFQAVLRGARGAGFPTSAEERRPFRPHITVARPRRPGVSVPADFYALCPELPWTPEHLALVESRPVSDGPPTYAPLRLQGLRP